MNDETLTGGPAFPVPSYVNVDGDTHSSRIKGMTLRNYYAAKAMQSLIIIYADRRLAPEEKIASICRDAYEISDEMLEADDL